MKGLGIRRARVDLLRESPDQVSPLLETYGRGMNRLRVTRGMRQLD
jgi:hypothetical protein